jgi:fucose 4-O-acetylase-like acetyltransferase
MLHGQETAGRFVKNKKSADYAGSVSLSALRGRGIDYLALGHIHAYKKAPLDSRGIYCYPGCLEGRGFDECGRKGFVLLVVGYSVLKTDMLTIGSAPWYLLALILWHIVLYLTKEKKAAYVLAAAVLLAAFANYQESIGKFLTLSRAINFMPFFLLGFYMTPERLQQVIGGKGRRGFFSAVFLLAAVAIILNGRAVKKWLGVFFFGVSPYSKLLKLGEWYYYAAPLICMLWMLCTVVLLFGLFALCPRGKTFLAKLGRNTIGIYIIHRLYKDFLIYGGFYALLGENPYVATGGVLLVSLLVTVVFGADFWARALVKLSEVHRRKV